MKITRYIPNAFTMANLFCGMLGTFFAATGRLDFAAYAVVLGIFFDFFDGFFARLFKVEGDLGLQLDSLADVVTSGVVPGMVMFQLLHKLEHWNTGERWVEAGLSWDSVSIIPFLGFAITLASAFRLAKFNIDTRQTNSFIGLPTPANALLIVSLPLIVQFQDYSIAESLITNTYFLLALTALSCFMLNAEIPLFALKFKNWGLAENKVRYGFLLLAVILLFWLTFLAIPIIILFYVLLSVATQNSKSA
ncbi:CDP-alcohol phosphatidyltransferase family protein [Leeuwenhoekiella sp. MAR_2009_132]|uniref:CDP-alcohol phosphatidyltransferase family protein n=1 Tax=Leeuwenhoekiella sp. MAR_2009_132 TaxID=1392489 RepID=UPI0009DF33B5|nr:CDP-alcohol phosphatidyltransferase family protein [Leeuwenhoekiella sp. MAR_2009_132]